MYDYGTLHIVCVLKVLQIGLLGTGLEYYFFEKNQWLKNWSIEMDVGIYRTMTESDGRWNPGLLIERDKIQHKLQNYIETWIKKIPTTSVDGVQFRVVVQSLVDHRNDTWKKN